MKSSENPGQGAGKRPLNLGKFAPGSPAPADTADDGPTMQLRRIAAKVVEKNVPEPVQNSADFGLPLQEMLGIITQCYARGVFCFERHCPTPARRTQAPRRAGRKLPNEEAVRSFRRRYAAEIEEALENLFRAYPGGGPNPATPETAEGTEELRREATQRVHEAAHTDNTKGRLG